MHTACLLTIHVVVTIKCQQQGPMSYVWWGGLYQPWTYPYPGHTHPLDIPTPRRELVPGIPTPGKHTGPEILTPPPPWTDWQTLVKTLPSRNYGPLLNLQAIISGPRLWSEQLTPGRAKSFIVNQSALLTRPRSSRTKIASRFVRTIWILFVEQTEIRIRTCAHWRVQLVGKIFHLCRRMLCFLSRLSCFLICLEPACFEFGCFFMEIFLSGDRGFSLKN